MIRGVSPMGSDFIKSIWNFNFKSVIIKKGIKLVNGGIVWTELPAW